jgi:hypothetical protein
MIGWIQLASNRRIGQGRARNAIAFTRITTRARGRTRDVCRTGGCVASKRRISNAEQRVARQRTEQETRADDSTAKCRDPALESSARFRSRKVRGSRHRSSLLDASHGRVDVTQTIARLDTAAKFQPQATRVSSLERAHPLGSTPRTTVSNERRPLRRSKVASTVSYLRAPITTPVARRAQNGCMCSPRRARGARCNSRMSVGRRAAPFQSRRASSSGATHVVAAEGWTPPGSSRDAFLLPANRLPASHLDRECE